MIWTAAISPFWILALAMPNTLLFGFTFALLSRVLSLPVGMNAGYLGGRTHRVPMSIK